jgi:hypothetical protein
MPYNVFLIISSSKNQIFAKKDSFNVKIELKFGSSVIFLLLQYDSKSLT